ncbi:O-antigen ligase family protein [Qipengyuania sp. NPDC077563]|uniref:O-antigen ligase family protein n=1 Tax=Qipengyuania sp. NPDC077563 TaxID=3364497 RepID=UPI00384D91C8
MSPHSYKTTHRFPRAAFILLAAFMLIVWIAGGASRADVLGQVVVRIAAWLILIVTVLVLPRPDWRATAPVTVLLAASIGLVVLQLVPLPSSLWANLPGREVLAQTAIVIAQPQPWRPISISPGATVNALSSLVVPAVVLLLLAQFTARDHKRLVVLMLGLIVASGLIGVLQFAGSSFQNPFVNNVANSVSGTFANRNHFALFIAVGCILAPVWAFGDRDASLWKMFCAIGLITVFALVILATGSRAGMLIGLAAIVLGLLSVGSHFRKAIKVLPQRVWLPVVAVFIVLLVLAIVLSISLDRAVSVDRAFSLNAAEDGRTAALPTVWQLTWLVFPIGAGFGTFDPLFRIYEPDYLLGPSYWNQAHNDWLAIVLDGGLVALILLCTAWIWWARRSIRVWLMSVDEQALRARAGANIILLIGLASFVDYPARTPIIMSVLVVAAVWLATGGEGDRKRSGSPR